MLNEQSKELNNLIVSIGKRIKSLSMNAGYKSYEVFTWENNLSRNQYWKMEKGTNCTLKIFTKSSKYIT